MGRGTHLLRPRVDPPLWWRWWGRLRVPESRASGELWTKIQLIQAFLLFFWDFLLVSNNVCAMIKANCTKFTLLAKDLKIREPVRRPFLLTVIKEIGSYKKFFKSYFEKFVVMSYILYISLTFVVFWWSHSLPQYLLPDVIIRPQTTTTVLGLAMIRTALVNIDHWSKDGRPIHFRETFSLTPPPPPPIFQSTILVFTQTCLSVVGLYKLVRFCNGRILFPYNGAGGGGGGG